MAEFSIVGETSGDALYRFTFEGAGVRGVLIKLDEVWRRIQGTHDYPATVASPLGQALAASALLSSTVKMAGSMILQIQGKGPLHMLVAQATHQRQVRAVARWGGEVPDGDLEAVFGPGRLVMTIDPEGGERYQGIVSLEGEDIAGALRAYFDRSEQLNTGIWLFADGEHAAGLMIQEMPSQSGDPEDWERIHHLAATVTADELLRLPAREVLHRLFHQETTRLYEPEAVAWFCGCSRDKLGQTLVTLGREDVEEMLAEQGGELELTCEFCNTDYRFDVVDVKALFADGMTMDGPRTRQ
ncbi:MAG: Hsp33 family molecular chaperone HslO [Gammaproteobacteria bacterium]